MNAAFTVRILGYPFVCYPLDQIPAGDVAAVYVILTAATNGGEPQILDVGETGQIKTRIASHERRACWERVAQEKVIWVGITLMPVAQFGAGDRQSLERSIRKVYQPPCGEE